jgi:hypothetical protein
MAICAVGLCAAARAQLLDEPAKHQETTVQPAIEKTLGYSPQLLPASQTTKTLKGILARPEYSKEKNRSDQKGLFQRFIEYLAKLLHPLGIKNGNWVVAAAIIVVAAIAVFLLLRMLSGLELRGKRQEEGPGRVEKPKSAGELMAEADKAAASGDFREAIRLRFRSMLRQLEIPWSAVQTNTQVVRGLSKEHPTVRGPLQNLVDCFEDAWYGCRSCGRTDYELAVQLASEVVQTVRSAEE